MKCRVREPGAIEGCWAAADAPKGCRGLTEPAGRRTKGRKSDEENFADYVTKVHKLQKRDSIILGPQDVRYCTQYNTVLSIIPYLVFINIVY